MLPVMVSYFPVLHLYYMPEFIFGSRWTHFITFLVLQLKVGVSSERRNCHRRSSQELSLHDMEHWWAGRKEPEEEDQGSSKDHWDVSLRGEGRVYRYYNHMKRIYEKCWLTLLSLGFFNHFVIFYIWALIVLYKDYSEWNFVLPFLDYREKPDIVFLQEVVPNTCQYLKDLLPQYSFYLGSTTEDYFTATLLHSTTVHFDGQTIVPFPNTIMGRNLLCVKVSVFGVLKLQLLCFLPLLDFFVFGHLCKKCDSPKKSENTIGTQWNKSARSP